jgi:hypothetical protein
MDLQIEHVNYERSGAIDLHIAFRALSDCAIGIY